MTDGLHAIPRRHPRQQRGAADIEQESQREAGEHEQHTARGFEPVKLAKEQGKHQRRLEGPNPAAGFIDAHFSRSELNDVAVLKCWNL